MNISYKRKVSAPYLFTISSGFITLPLDLLIFSPPSAKISPCEVRFLYGSEVGTNFKSYKNLCQNLEYKRCKVVCSFPPLYQSTPLEVAAPRSEGLATKSRARLLTGSTPSQYFKFFWDANSFEFF